MAPPTLEYVRFLTKDLPEFGQSAVQWAVGCGYLPLTSIDWIDRVNIHSVYDFIVGQYQKVVRDREYLAVPERRN